MSTATTPRASAKAATANPSREMSLAKARTAKADQQAGNRPGVDYYETDVSLDELIDLMFEDLGAARPRAQAAAQNRSRAIIQAKRLSPQRHPRPARQKTHRAFADQAEEGDANQQLDARLTPRRSAFPFTKTTCATITRLPIPARNPTPSCLCIMDTSGSMDTDEKIPSAELFLPALSIYLDALSKR